MSASRAYRLKPKESLPEGIPRVARGRIDHAVDELRGKTDSSADEAVHEARKDLKKLRALLRLARGELGESSFARENTCFRDDLKEFEQLGAQVFGISVDSVWTHAAFAKSLVRFDCTARVASVSQTAIVSYMRRP